MQPAYAVRRVCCINIAASQMIVVVVGAAAGNWSAATAARARSVAVGALVPRPPLNMCVCNKRDGGTDAQNCGHSCWNSCRQLLAVGSILTIAIVGRLFAPATHHGNHDDGPE